MILSNCSQTLSSLLMAGWQLCLASIICSWKLFRIIYAYSYPFSNVAHFLVFSRFKMVCSWCQNYSVKYRTCYKALYRVEEIINFGRAKNCRFTVYIPLFTCKSHSHSNVLNPGTTSANNIQNYLSCSSVQYSESYTTPSKWEGCQEIQSFLQRSLRFNDERLIRVYFDRISTQARNSGSDLITTVHILQLDGSCAVLLQVQKSPLSLI